MDLRRLSSKSSSYYFSSFSSSPLRWTRVEVLVVLFVVGREDDWKILVEVLLVETEGYWKTPPRLKDNHWNRH